MATFADLEGIKTFLQAQIGQESGIGSDVRIVIDHPMDDVGTLSAPFINIASGALEAPDSAQVISAGTKLRLDGRIFVAVGFHAFDRAAAISMRDAVLQRVVVAAMRDPKFGGRAMSSRIERIERDQEGDAAGWVSGGIVVLLYRTEISL